MVRATKAALIAKGPRRSAFSMTRCHAKLAACTS